MSDETPIPIAGRALPFAEIRLANIGPMVMIYPLVMRCIAHIPGACKMPGTFSRFSRLG